MTHEKAQKGDLIRAVVSCNIDGYNVGDILEVRQSSEIAVSTDRGSILNHGEYVIHRKAGEEDIDGDVGACASCGKEGVHTCRGAEYHARKAEIGRFEAEKAQDAVNSPSHYTQSKFETIEIIEEITKGYSDGYVAYCVGNALKYLARAPFKHGEPTEDLAKAAKYLAFANEYLDAKSTQN